MSLLLTDTIMLRNGQSQNTKKNLVYIFQLLHFYILKAIEILISMAFLHKLILSGVPLKKS